MSNNYFQVAKIELPKDVLVSHPELDDETDEPMLDENDQPIIHFSFHPLLKSTYRPNTQFNSYADHYGRISIHVNDITGYILLDTDGCIWIEIDNCKGKALMSASDIKAYINKLPEVWAWKDLTMAQQDREVNDLWKKIITGTELENTPTPNFFLYNERCEYTIDRYIALMDKWESINNHEDKGNIMKELVTELKKHLSYETFLLKDLSYILKKAHSSIKRDIVIEEKCRQKLREREIARQLEISQTRAHYEQVKLELERML